MGVHRGANLVGMSLLLLDVCPFSWFTEKKCILVFIKNYFFNVYCTNK